MTIEKLKEKLNLDSNEIKQGLMTILNRQIRKPSTYLRFGRNAAKSNKIERNAYLRFGRDVSKQQ